MENIEHIEEYLLDLKEKIDRAEKEQSRTEGQIDHLMKQLNKEFNCTTEAKGKKLLEKLTSDYEELQQQLREGAAKMAGEYGNE